jgi:L-2-hydroxycarboxylate dehydrogenase (NAD+)
VRPTDPVELAAFARAILEAAGLESRDAEAAARALVTANLRGVDSHGVLRLTQYVRSIEEGAINLRPEVEVIRERGAAALIDADRGYGFRPSYLAAEIAARLAETHGVGLVGVRNSHHFGMGATFALDVAERGMIGFLTTTTLPSLSPPGHGSAVIGNNPLVFAVPRRPPARPVVLDMAVSVAAFGRIRLAAEEAQPIPPTWARGVDGHPTTSAADALAAQMLEPIGGHKGFGLGVMTEILAGVYTGSLFGTEANAHGNGVGHLVIGLNPGWFVEEAAFVDGVESLLGQLTAASGESDEALSGVPGAHSWATHDERVSHGIPLSADLVRSLDELAGRLGVTSGLG